MNPVPGWGQFWSSRWGRFRPSDSRRWGRREQQVFEGLIGEIAGQGPRRWLSRHAGGDLKRESARRRRTPPRHGRSDLGPGQADAFTDITHGATGSGYRRGAPSNGLARAFGKVAVAFSPQASSYRAPSECPDSSRMARNEVSGICRYWPLKFSSFEVPLPMFAERARWWPSTDDR